MSTRIKLFGEYGTVNSATYSDGSPALVIEFEDGMSERLTTNMRDYGLPPALYVKNWSEHEGLAETLAKAGVVRIVKTIPVPFNPFDLTVTEVEVIN